MLSPQLSGYTAYQLEFMFPTACFSQNTLPITLARWCCCCWGFSPHLHISIAVSAILQLLILFVCFAKLCVSEFLITSFNFHNLWMCGGWGECAANNGSGSGHVSYLFLVLLFNYFWSKKNWIVSFTFMFLGCGVSYLSSKFHSCKLSVNCLHFNFRFLFLEWLNSVIIITRKGLRIFWFCFTWD